MSGPLEKVNRITDQQGWSEETLLTIVFQFVITNNLVTELETFLQDRVDEEGVEANDRAWAEGERWGDDEEDDEPTNCLAGMKCPQCFQYEKFLITGTDNVGTRTLEFEDDGCEDTDGDFEYDDTAACSCRCGWTGTVGEAKSDGKENGN